jgi:hypothetical protein
VHRAVQRPSKATRSPSAAGAARRSLRTAARPARRIPGTPKLELGMCHRPERRWSGRRPQPLTAARRWRTAGARPAAPQALTVSKGAGSRRPHGCTVASATAVPTSLSTTTPRLAMVNAVQFRCICPLSMPTICRYIFTPAKPTAQAAAPYAATRAPTGTRARGWSEVRPLPATSALPTASTRARNVIISQRYARACLGTRYALSKPRRSARNSSQVRLPTVAPARARFSPARYDRPAFPGIRIGTINRRVPRAFR